MLKEEMLNRVQHDRVKEMLKKFQHDNSRRKGTACVIPNPDLTSGQARFGIFRSKGDNE